MTNEQTHKHTNLRVVCHINFVQRDKEARGFAQGVGLDEKGKGLARDDAVSRVRPGRRGQPRTPRTTRAAAASPNSHRNEARSHADILGLTSEAPRSVSTRRQCISLVETPNYMSNDDGPITTRCRGDAT